jgi:hypothetical protein
MLQGLFLHKNTSLVFQYSTVQKCKHFATYLMIKTNVVGLLFSMLTIFLLDVAANV